MTDRGSRSGKTGLWTAVLAAGGLSLTLLAASVSAQSGGTPPPRVSPSVPAGGPTPSAAAPGMPGAAGGPPNPAALNPAALPPGTAAAGQGLAASCQGCHGPLGVSSNPGVPRLAGQHPSYLRVQLLLYRAGIRQNRVMNRVASRLSDQNISDLSAYFSAQQVGPAWPAQPADAALTGVGARLYALGDVNRNITACVVCHGRQGQGVNELGVALIRHQSPAYTVDVLHEFKGLKDSGSPTAMAMYIVANPLTEDEMKELAAYISTLP